MLKRTTPVVVAILVLVVGLVFTTHASKMPFPDVPDHHWAYDAIADLAAAGIVIGYPDGEFKGSNAFTRYEMAMVVSRLIEDIKDFAASEIDWQLDEKLQSFAARISEDVSGELADVIAAELDALSAKFAEAMAVLDRASMEQKEEIKASLEKAKLGLQADFDAAKALLLEQLTAEQDAFKQQIEVYVRALVTDLVAERLSELTPGLSKEEALELLVSSEEIAELYNDLDQVRLIAELAASSTERLDNQLADYAKALAEAQVAVERALEVARVSSEIAEASKDAATEAMRIGNVAYSTAAEAQQQVAEIQKVVAELETLSDVTAATANRAEALVQQFGDVLDNEIKEMAKNAVQNSDLALTRSTEALAYGQEAKTLSENALKVGQSAQVSATEALTVAKEGFEVSKSAEQIAREASELATKLQQVVDVLNSQMESFDLQLAALSKDTDALKALIDLKTASIVEQLTVVKADLAEEIDAVYAFVNARNAVIESKIEDVVFRIGRTNLALERVEAELDASEAELREEIDALYGFLSLFESKDRVLESKIEDVLFRLGRANLAMERLEAKLDGSAAELRDEIEGLYGVLSMYESKDKILESKIEDVLFRLGRANLAMERLEAKLDGTEAELLEEIDALYGMLSLFESKNAVLQSKIDDLMFRIDRTNLRADLLEASIDLLEEKVQANAAALSNLQGLVATLDGEIKALKANQVQLEARVAQLEKGQGELFAAVDDLDKATTQLRKDHDALAGAFDEFVAKFGNFWLYGDTKLELVNRAVVAGDAAKLYKDPHERDSKSSSPAVYDPPTSQFAHKLTIGFQAYPSDNVLVKGNLATLTNFFGGTPDFAVRLADMNVTVETPNVLRLVYFGSLDDNQIAGTFDKYTIDKKKIESLKMFGAKANLVLSDNLRADAYFSRLDVGEYLAAVYGEYDISGGKLYGRFVSWFTDPYVGAGAPAYARDRVAQVGAVGTVANFDYDLKYTLDKLGKDPASATELKLKTRIGAVDFDVWFGNVDDNFSAKFAKALSTQDGDLLPDQREYVLSASVPVLGATFKQEVGRLDTSVTQGHYKLSNITALKGVDLRGFVFDYERRDVTTNDVSGKSGQVENLLEAKANVFDFSLQGAYFTRNLDTTADVDHIIGRMSLSRKINPFDLPVVLTVDAASLRMLSADDRQHYRVALDIDNMPLGPGISFDATFQWITRDILDNKWTEVDKWQDNRKTIGGLKSVMDVGDGLSFAAGYQLTTTEDLVTAAVTEKIGTASIGLDYVGRLFDTNIGVGIAYDQSNDLLNSVSLAPETKLSLTADREVYGGSLRLEAKQSTGLDVKRSDRYTARTADVKYVYPLGNGFNLSLSSEYASLNWETNVDEDYKVWEALATVGFTF